MPRVHLGRVPPALVLGLVAVVVASAVLSSVSTWVYTRDAIPRWGAWIGARLQLIGPATMIAAFTVALVGARQLGRGTIAGVIAPLGLALVIVGQLYVLYVRYGWLPAHDLVDDADLARYRALIDRRWWISGAGMVVFSIGLIAAGARVRRSQILAGPLVALAVLATTPAAVVRWLEGVLVAERGPDLGGALAFDAVILALDVAFTAVALVVARAAAEARAPIAPPPRLAISGLRAASFALTMRVALAAASPMLLLIAWSTPELARVWLYVIPLAIVGAQVTLVVGLARASDGPDAAWPRRRLAVAGALVAWAVVVQAIQLVVMWQQARGHQVFDGRELTTALAIATPAVGLAGLLFAVSAAGALARRAAGRVDAGAVASVAWMVALASLAAIGFGAWLTDAVQRGRAGFGAVFLPAALVAVTTILAHVALARLLRTLAADLAAVPAADLPVAALRR